MIRQRLELMIGKISDSLFIDVMDATKADVVTNRINFMQKTSFDSVINRAIIAYGVFIRLIDKCPRCDKEDNHATANYCNCCGYKLNE